MKEQMGFRHFQVMQRLVAIASSDFAQQVRNLKNQGLKTEPAIARLMKLQGDPYQAVADLELLTDKELEHRLQLLNLVEVAG